MHLWASTAQPYSNMDKDLQPLLTSLFLLAAVVRLNSSFHHVTNVPVYTCRGKDNVIIQRTATVPVFSGAISPSLIEITLLRDLWFQRNGEKTLVCWSRSALINLNEKLRPHVEGTTTMQAFVLTLSDEERLRKITFLTLTLTLTQSVWIILTSCFCHHWARL